MSEHIRRRFPFLLNSILFAAVFFTVCLSGCGEVADTSGLSGVYQLVYADAQMLRWTTEVDLELPVHLELNADGTGIIRTGAESGRILWAVQNGTLQVRASELVMKGALEPEGFSLQFSEESPALHFERLNPASEEVDEGAATDESPELLPSEWYGWWKIENSEGQMPDSWYDCCALIHYTSDDELRFILWDENGSRAEPLSEVRMKIGENGQLLSLGGYFLYDAIEYGEWMLPAGFSDFYLEDCLHDAGGERFRYSVYMKPWGTRWSASPADQLPFYYEDWYLPNGRATMPESIPWEMIEENRATIAAVP